MSSPFRRFLKARWIPVAALFIICLLGVSARGAAPIGAHRIDEVTGLIPRTAEAVFVANGPFLLNKVAAPDVPEKAKAPLEARLRGLAMGLPGDALVTLSTVPGVTAVAQAVATNSSHTAALTIYAGSHLVLLATAPEFRSADVLERLKDPDSRPLQIDGTIVVTRSRTTPGTVPYSLFLAMPRPNLLVSAGSAGAMEEIILRAASSSSGVELPRPLAAHQWQVDTAAPCWGIRHLTEADYLWRDVPPEDWPDAMLFQWRSGRRAQLTYVGYNGMIRDRATQAFRRRPFSVRGEDFGLVTVRPKGGASTDAIIDVVLQALGYLPRS